MPRDLPLKSTGQGSPAAQLRRQREQLNQLLAALFPAPANGARVPSDQQLRNCLLDTPMTEESVSELLARVQAGWTPDARQTGLLEVARLVLQDYLGQPVFHPELAALILDHAQPVLASTLEDDNWFLRRHHPVSDLLGLMAQLAQGWDPDQPQAREVSDALTDWLGALKGQDADQVLADAVSWLSRFHERVERVTDRVAERESGALRLQYVRQQAAKTLSRQLAGRSLPDFMVRQLMDHWLPGLQWILLQQGEEGALWSNVTRCLGLLIWSLQQEAGEEANRPKFDRVIGQLADELPDLVDAFVRDESARDAIIEQIEIAHLSLRSGQPMHYTEVPALDGTSLLDQVNAEISRDLMEDIGRLQVGDWFERRDQNGQRLQLLLKDNVHHQLLFVNQAGIRAFSCAWDEFAWLLASGDVAAIAPALELSEFVMTRLNGLAEQLRERKRQKQKALAREAAKVKARDEAERLQQAQQQARDEEAAQQQQAEQASRERQARQRARLQVSGLPVGGWLAFREQGAQVRRKLAVMLPSSGKYIFVDQTGSDKLELRREELIDGMASGDIELVKADARFDDVLNRLVEGKLDA